jgi:Type II site-specific deoxyribonuclease
VDSGIFDQGFLTVIKTFIDIHHSLYPTVPPQGIYFEALVEKAFRETKRPFSPIEPGGRNQPRHDLLVEGARLSLKTETGYGTDPTRINITKLCTTERDPWEAEMLKRRALEHLQRYDVILMLRAVWEEKTVRYQLVEIPVSLLALLAHCQPTPVGKRKGRRSLGADVLRGEEIVFHVHFDGSDGKCQIRGLRLADCILLAEWDKRRSD